MKKVEIPVSDFKEAYKFNMQPEEKKNRKQANLAVWSKDSEKAKVNYETTKANHRYPKGGAPHLRISPRDLIEETHSNAEWPVRHIIEKQVKQADKRFEDADIDELHEDEEFQDWVDSWMEEARELFWAAIEFKDEIKLPDYPEYDKLKIEMISEKEERMKQLEEETFLSKREAELYVLTEELGHNTVQASDLMGISKNNAYGKRGLIKEKIQKAEKTAEISI